MSRTDFYLLVNSCSPGQGALAREVLDAALACATFDMGVRVLFCGEAIRQLTGQQQRSPLTGKTIGDSWRAAPLYDVQGLYVDGEELAGMGLVPQDLIEGVTVAGREDVGALFAGAKQVLSF